MSGENAPGIPEESGDGDIENGDAEGTPAQTNSGDQISHSVEASLTFSGPLPPPEMYGAYEAQVPGTAERMWEQVSRVREERHEFAMRHLELEYRGIRLASILLMTLILVVVLAILATAWFLFDTGKPVYGGVATVSDVLLVAYAIARLRRQNKPADEDDSTAVRHR